MTPMNTHVQITHPKLFAQKKPTIQGKGGRTYYTYLTIEE
jgi:hypothetical protein